MKLCMFSPADRELDRGWPGRVDGDVVVQLAAQTLQAFFTGGGAAREHAEYPLAEVVLRAPVLHPPSVRLFDEGGDFAFANPAAIQGPGDAVRVPGGAGEIVPVARRAAIVGLDGAVGATTLLVEWVAPELDGAKQRDFVLTLGPLAVTPDEVPAAELDALLAHAGRNTRLLPGDLVAEPGSPLSPLRAGQALEYRLEPFGLLSIPVVG
ncbi:MAG: hypothetical protein JOZ56_10230 [Actinobacteria bacterium]|nr:hypothetical protein [Actinomycetota bacterium]